MKASIVILACFCTAAASNCPITSRLPMEDYEKWENLCNGNNGVIRVRRHKKVRKRVETGPAVLYKDYGHHPTVAHLWNGRLETTEQSCRNGSFEKCLTVGVVLGSVTLRQRERSEHENTPESPAFGGQSR
ncbi:hypothetical protein Y032_0168g197 [Ancylostoma ceylanicum]|uniref:Uncharacterized protein n=1 Tax=Ancylostoma ceylanicum TaxID=53326 RepID=A0A016SWD8_9BILA|nr:hypothetical protein Y032_0168g197 [Ancylostoma ceylanicum]